jgi:hypothetical protein
MRSEPRQISVTMARLLALPEGGEWKLSTLTASVSVPEL